MVRYTAEELAIGMAVMQRLVNSCEWRHNQRLAQSMCRHLISLAQHGANFKHFYAPEDFWSYVDQPESEDDDSTEEMDSQSGGANEEAGPSRYPIVQGIVSEDDEPGPSHYHSLHGFQSELESDEEPDTNRYLTLHGFQPESDSDDEQGLTQYPTFRGIQQEDVFRPQHFYTIYHASPPVYARKFNTERKHYAVKFHNIDHLENADVNMESIFDSVLGDILDGFTPNDSTGLQINHPALDKPIFIPLTKHSNLNGYKILAEIMRVQQSKTDLAIDQEMQIITVSVRPPNGSGWVQRPINFDAWFKKSRSKIAIKNKDNLCMARAIVTAMAYIQKDPKYESIRHGDQQRKTSLQKCRATQLMWDAGLAKHIGPCGIPEARAMQAVIKKDCKLKIFAHDQQSIIYPSDIYPCASDATAEICLYLKDNHYDVITSLPGFFNYSYWCHTCDIGYDKKAKHKCTNTCSGCFTSPPCNITGTVTCSDCNRWFANQRCFNTHKKKNTGYIKKGKKRIKTESSICDRYKHCLDCGQLIKDAHKKKHICNTFKCPTCKQTLVRGEHYCYMQPLTSHGDRDNNSSEETEDEEKDGSRDLQEAKEVCLKKYVFFDFETTQYEPLGQNEQGPIYKHTPNLCIAHTVCAGCRNDETTICLHCGQREMVFWGDNCQHNFCDWLFALGTKQQPVIAMAHNAKGFDGQFIMQYLEKQGHLKPKIIDKGLELMCIEAGHVKIIDSLNFLPMGLKSMPKAFGLEELAKGYFPHLFNKPQNYNYIGAWPDVKYYAPASMKTEERLQFELWYANQILKTFNFMEEITKYCRSDVDILRRAVLKFQDIFIQTSTVDPFEHSLTIASACMRVFRTLFLKPDTIGIIPHGGYRTKQRQSNKALKWLKWESKKRSIHINHARNGGEFKVGKFLADGHHGNELFEFNGCYWHGCRTCMKDRRQRTADQQLTAEEAYTQTILRRNTILAAGYTITEIWECELDQQLNANPEMKQFFDSVELAEPMDPREAFYGGRTNAVQLYTCIKRDVEGRPTERIDYTDICSLYPFICKYGKFPVGHPEIITENFADLSCKPYEGVIKCRVVPPRQLLHPSLPYRSNGKLTFPLCGSCADSMQITPCMHNDDERSLLACWITMDIYKALELGYRITNVFEVYHYKEVAQYDPETKTGGLFAGYIDMFVKTKQQADGWPSWVKNESDKERYVNNYLAHEGIQLDKEAIVKNPGLRNHAKLMLNSFWGKFGQRNNKRKTEFIDKPNNFFARLQEAGRIIHSIRIVNEHMLHVVSSMEDDFVEVLSNTNAVIAAYVTTQARLKLYNNIEQLGGRLIYFDTDSIIFKSQLNQPDQYQVPIGSYLGDMTNELKNYGEGAYIEEVASTGPKSYGLKIYSPATNSHHYIVKVKGFSLTSAVSKELNFETLKDFVHKYVLYNVNEKVSVNFNQIARTVERNVVTKPMCKDFRVVYAKRVVQSDFTTLPYGY